MERISKLKQMSYNNSIDAEINKRVKQVRDEYTSLEVMPYIVKTLPKTKVVGKPPPGPTIWLVLNFFWCNCNTFFWPFSRLLV